MKTQRLFTAVKLAIGLTTLALLGQPTRSDAELAHMGLVMLNADSTAFVLTAKGDSLLGKEFKTQIKDIVVLALKDTSLSKDHKLLDLLDIVILKVGGVDRFYASAVQRDLSLRLFEALVFCYIDQTVRENTVKPKGEVKIIKLDVHPRAVKPHKNRR